jgi:hypothetical protein
MSLPVTISIGYCYHPVSTKRLALIAARQDMSAVILSKIPIRLQSNCNDDQASRIMSAAPASMAFIK